MTELQRLIETVWPLKEGLVITDISNIVDSANAISINDTIMIEWDDTGYGIGNEQTERVISCGAFDLDEVVLLAIQAYVKHIVDYGLGMLHDIEEGRDEVGKS